MIQNNCEILVLVKGKPVTEYPHNGQIYIEGREASEYEIEFRNRNPFRVEVVLSVDGLSVLDGQDAGPHSRGYVVDANGTLKVPGWKLDAEKVARFAFGGKGASYAAQTSGSARNTGVIGALVYREVAQSPSWGVRGFPGGGVIGGPIPSAGVLRGMAKGTVDTMLHNSRIGANAAQTGEVKTSGGVLQSPYDIARYYSGNVAAQASAAAAPQVQQELGTVFGRADDFRTQQVTFTRADLQVMMVLYYDSSRGLKARGIEIARPSRTRYTSEPDAFPAMARGCTPPPGWKG